MKKELAEIKELWLQAWPEALSTWSPYTRLSPPRWAATESADERLGLIHSFACIRVNDHSIRISLRQIQELDLRDYAAEILSHEIGHHVFCPGNLLEAGQALAVATLALPGVEQAAPQVVNMWEDLLINDRLVRLHEQRHAEIYERLAVKGGSEPGRLWRFYMRTFEILWGLEKGRLCGRQGSQTSEGDAYLAARMVRVFARDWMRGVGGYASLCLPYLLEERGGTEEPRFRLLQDTTGIGAGCEVPLGLLDLDDIVIVHPSRDPRVSGNLGEDVEGPAGEPSPETAGSSLGQNRQPFLFGQVLKALGFTLDSHDAAVKFYREKALPHLIPFPTIEVEQSQEPLMEGLEPWEAGFPMEHLDWLQSVLVSPRVIPGLTTVQRTWGVMGGVERDREPLDLDLYVDCSGSMPNPQTALSFLALAGAIVVLSALRAGARVQATLWSGPGQFDKTAGFVRDETAILRVLTAYLGGSTAFPNHILRDTYSGRSPTGRPVHILILSDEGIDTMENSDEKGTPGMEISRTSLELARGGGTMVLNLFNDNFMTRSFAVKVAELGWDLYKVKSWAELVQFAREFSRRKYSGGHAEKGSR